MQNDNCVMITQMLGNIIVSLLLLQGVGYQNKI